MTRGDKIRALRLQHGLTLEDVGKACGVSKATVSRWESGAIDNMRADKLNILARLFCTTVAFLIDEDPDLEAVTLRESMTGQRHPLEVLHYLSTDTEKDIVEINPEEENPYNKVKTEYDIREEELELLKVYRTLGFRDRVQLLHYAFELQGETIPYALPIYWICAAVL